MYVTGKQVVPGESCVCDTEYIMKTGFGHKASAHIADVADLRLKTAAAE